MRRSALDALRAAGLVSVLASSLATANTETFTYGADAGVSETDNVTLTHTDRVSQTIAVSDLDFDFKERSQRLDADAKGDFSYLDYLQNAFHNQLLGRFDGNATFALVPQRLTWVIQDDYGQAAIDPFTPIIPTNLESVNYVATGPDLTLRLGRGGFLDVSARAARAQYGSSPFSNTRGIGSIAWGEKLSALSSVSLNVDSTRVLFENTLLNQDFSRSNAFLEYALQGARSEVSAEAGATRVDQGGGSTTGGLVNIKLSRSISASSKLALTFGRALTDGSTSFSVLQSGALGVTGTAPAINTSQNYTGNYGSLGWDYQRNRTSLGVSGRWEKDVYPGLAALDRTLITGEARLERQLTRTFAAQILGRVYRYDSPNVTVLTGSPRNTTGTVAASITWRHGRALEVKLAAEHTTYTTAPNDTGYKENRVFLTVGYRPFRGSTDGQVVPAI